MGCGGGGGKSRSAARNSLPAGAGDAGAGEPGDAGEGGEPPPRRFTPPHAPPTDRNDEQRASLPTEPVPL